MSCGGANTKQTSLHERIERRVLSVHCFTYTSSQLSSGKRFLLTGLLIRLLFFPIDYGLNKEIKKKKKL